VRSVLGVALLVVAVVGWGLWASYRQAVAAELQVLGVLARAVASRVDATLASADATLRGTVGQFDTGEFTPRDPAVVPALVRRNAALPLFETLAVTDEDGRVLAQASDGTGPAPQRIDVAPLVGARGRFALARVAVEPPRSGDVADPGRRVLAAALPWVSPQGSGRGFIVALAEPDHFGREFGQISPTRAAALSLWSDDGALLDASAAPGPRQAEAVRAALAGAGIARDGLSLPPALEPPRAPAMLLQPLTAHQFVLAVERDIDPLLDTWRAQAAAVAVLTALGLLLALLLAVRSVRHAQRVQAAEAAAAQAATQLALRVQTRGKMEALGALAGGIAHDFNNVLAAVVGYAEMARDAAADGSAQARHLDQVLQAGLRGKAMVGRILGFSRSGLRPNQRFAVQPLVQEVLALLDGTPHEAVRVRAELDADGAELTGDATLLFECVMNLCTNALQAMPDGGELQVRLQRLRLAQPRALSHGVALPGEHLVLAVGDTGAGIDDAVLPRIFEPFFSTKSPAPGAAAGHVSGLAAGGGTGLGLAVAHGAVADFGGAIDLRTGAGRGTTLTLYLPLDTAEAGPLARAAAAEPAPPAAARLPMGHGQIVMLVDDEPALLALGEEMLAALGYEPVSYADGRQALADFERDPLRVDGVLTDHLMPGLTGLALARAIHDRRPGLPVLLLSGHIGPQAVRDSVGVHTVLAKPLQREALARALHEALGTAPGAAPGAAPAQAPADEARQPAGAVR
jgi:signal transduction histidine kinase